MGCFKIRLGLCHDIEALIKKFFWGQRGDRRKIHWVRWDELTNRRWQVEWDFEIWLFTMIPFWQSKHGDYYTIGHLHFIRFSKPPFFPNCSIMEAKDSRSGSYVWKSILKVEMSYKKGC